MEIRFWITSSGESINMDHWQGKFSILGFVLEYPWMHLLMEGEKTLSGRIECTVDYCRRVFFFMHWSWEKKGEGKKWLLVPRRESNADTPFTENSMRWFWRCRRRPPLDHEGSHTCRLNLMASSHDARVKYIFFIHFFFLIFVPNSFMPFQFSHRFKAFFIWYLFF